jgi:hypothetical protein
MLGAIQNLLGWNPAPNPKSMSQSRSSSRSVTQKKRKHEREDSSELKRRRTEFSEFTAGIKEHTPSPVTLNKKNPKFPETVFLCVKVHGGYEYSSNSSSTYFELPNGVTLRTINAAPIGECYIGGQDDDILNGIVDMLQSEQIQFELKEDELQENIDYITKEIASTLKKEEISRLKQMKIKEFAHSLQKKVKSIVVHHSDKVFQIITYPKNSQVPKKGFQIQLKDIFLSHDFQHDKYTSRLTVLNMSHLPNLADTAWFNLKQDQYSIEHGGKTQTVIDIQLEDIIKYLSDYGAKNIVLIDFSCSGIYGATEREVRNLRRNSFEPLPQIKKPKKPRGTQRKTPRKK